jgi:hypothetical protein
MNAHEVANNILNSRNLPLLHGIVTDVDVWPHLCNVSGERVLVLDSDTCGDLYEPSHLILPGKKVELTSRLGLNNIIILKRLGFTKYQIIYERSTSDWDGGSCGLDSVIRGLLCYLLDEHLAVDVAFAVQSLIRD